MDWDWIGMSWIGLGQDFQGILWIGLDELISVDWIRLGGMTVAPFLISATQLLPNYDL